VLHAATALGGAISISGRKSRIAIYGRSSGFCIDPIEKKPLNHFLPDKITMAALDDLHYPLVQKPVRPQRNSDALNHRNH
jgi:hypothetical protein